jgi:Thiamine monophosphate synthase
MHRSHNQRAENERATTRLYLITPPALDPGQFAKELEEALAGGDVASLQLRLKDCDDDVIRHATRMLSSIATACMSARKTCPMPRPAVSSAPTASSA